MPEDDISYFRRRAIEERIAARRAECAEARFVHDELASMYRFRAVLLEESPNAGRASCSISWKRSAERR